jgi:serine/threonine protein kinase
VSNPAAPGRVLDGRYRLDSLIARGGMASVWSARDELLARPVAVKTLHPELGVDDSLRVRFRNEAIAVASLAHPDIVATYDTGEDDGVAYFVMELVDGPNLRTILEQRGHLDVAEAVRVARGVSAALDHAHRNGIVHRDIKPANVLVPNHGPVKVTDFGIAKAEGTGDLTRTGTVVGTARYLAPEQLQAEPVDARADVYAVGLLLFEMLAGRPAFTGGTDMEMALARLTTTPPLLRSVRADVPAELEAITARCLAVDPDGRFANAADLLAALDRLGDDDPGGAPRSSAGTATVARPATGPTTSPAPARVRRPPRQRSAWPWAILGVVLLAAGAAGGYFAVLAARDDSPPTSTVNGVSPQIVRVSDFDPEGDGSEHPESVAAATDGNPATAWTTETYDSPDFGGLKAGVGLQLVLAEPADVSAVEIETAEGGWSADVYVAAEPADTLSGWGAPRASIQDASTSQRLDLGPPPPVGAAVLVWFTHLPPSGRVTVDEVRLV